MRRIGLFGGTFNPVHFGHLNLAVELKEKCFLDEVWWIPASLSPFRQSEPPIAAEHRAAMIHLAIDEVPQFRLLDIEISRPPPSFTIDTIREIVHPSEKFFLMLGEDALLKFREWKEAEEIAQKVSFLIGYRHKALLKEKIPLLGLSALVQKKIDEGLVETRLMEISSTDVRERVKNQLFCGHLVPPKVLNYIYENQLYT